MVNNRAVVGRTKEDNDFGLSTKCVVILCLEKINRFIRSAKKVVMFVSLKIIHASFDNVSDFPIKNIF